jgi:hypothetical protein
MEVRNKIECEETPEKVGEREEIREGKVNWV